MASEPDDNPFARPGPWPKQPRQPISITSKPRTEFPAPPPEPPRRTVTPLYVRSTETAQPLSLLTGGGVTPPRRPPAPAPAPAPAPGATLAPSAPRPPVVRAPEAPRAAEPAASAAPLIAPPRRPAVRRRSATPAIVATVVGITGVAGLVFLLTTGREAARAPASAPPVAAAPAEPPTAIASPPTAAPPRPSPPPAAPPSTASRSAEPRLAGAKVNLSRQPPSRRSRPPCWPCRRRLRLR